MKICNKLCDECLFSPNKIVDNERKQEIIQECTTGQGRHFLCHKASIVGQEITCRGFYEIYGERVNLIRVMERLPGGIEFVPVPGEVTDSSQTDQ